MYNNMNFQYKSSKFSILNLGSVDLNDIKIIKKNSNQKKKDSIYILYKIL